MDHVVSWRHMYAEVALLVMVWGLLAGGAASFTLLVLILTRD